MNEGNTGRNQQPVYFFSDDIIADQELDANEIAVPLGRVCNNLGLDLEIEVDRIQSNPILVAGLGTMPMETDRGGRQPCLRVDLLPLWLLHVSLVEVVPEARQKLELFQHECASVLWQAFKPQGFNPEDTLVPGPHDMTPPEQAYQAMMGMATLARQQMMIERQIDVERAERDRPREQVIDALARQMAQAVRVVANSLATRTLRNEYGGVYQGLFRQFGITSFRNMPRGRFVEAMEWLERWRGDIEGEPEPPPDI